MTAQAAEQINEGNEANAEIIPIQPESEVIDRAKLMGWVPKEEFKGDESRWRPADEFVSRADELMPIMKAQLRKYETELSGLKTTIEEQKKTTEKLVKMGETVSQQAYERAKRELVQQQMEAVATGNVTAWERLEGEKEKLVKPEPIPVPENRVEPLNPDFQQWHQGNDWYLKDEDMTMFANTYGQKLAKDTPNLPYPQWLANVEDKIKKAFPHKFTNPKRDAASIVDSGAGRTGGVTSTRAKSYNDLPADAKKQCDIYVRDGLIKTREAYTKSYFGEE